MVCFIIFFFISYKGAKRYPSSSKDETDNFTFRKPFKKDNPKIIVLVFTLVFLLGIILGADLMVRGGVSLAKIFGVSSWVISITVFAVGTSLPELVASLTAIKKKVPSISVGNVVGSNIFNIFFVLGIIAMMRPIGLQPAILRFEFPVLLVFSLILFVVMKTNYRIARWEGFTMFLGYIGFLFFLLRE